MSTANEALLLPAPAIRALDVLEEAGFEAWCVGGFVRDALLGRPCADIDIATSAPWQDVRRLFEGRGCHTHETGTAHGTITVVVDDMPFEVTTYRSDGHSKDARHPERVTFVRTIEEDLARRDFTINALAYHPSHGLRDPHGGQADLDAHIVRTVGAAEERFAEDALRILRACRFASQLGFALDSATYAAMMSRKNLLSHISSERIAHELQGLLLGDFAHDALMGTADVLAAVLPEAVAMKGFDQRTPYHVYDVWEHTAWVVQHVPAYPLARWAALFHDMGKPAAFFTGANGIGHFYGHAAISTMLARGIMNRLKLPTALREGVLALVVHHDDVIEATPKAVKRALARLGGSVELFSALCDLKQADARAQAPRCASRIGQADALRETLAGILAKDEAFSLKRLAIGGHDVLALGVPGGPAVGEALAAALAAVIDEDVPNDAEALRGFVRAWMRDRERPRSQQAQGRS